MVDFTDGPAAAGFFSPERFDADIYDCEVEGTIPAGIDGCFVRVGGEWFYPGKFEDDSPFSADGYVSSFRIHNGMVDFKGRYVRTPRFMNNLQAGRQLYGTYRNPYTNDPEYQHLDKPYLGTVQNTAPFAHAGKMFTLKEDAHPFEIDPNTLETLGPWDFYGDYKSQTFSAHPKTDPVTGEMVVFGYEATGLLSDDCWVYIMDKEGRVTKEMRIKVPYISAMHDMVLTQEHIVLPLFGYVTSEEQLKAGKTHWAWDATAPTYYGILPRNGDAEDLRWFKGPPSAVFHTANGRTEGNKVIIEAPISDGNPFPFFPSVDDSPWDPVLAQHTIRRLTFDLDSDSETWQEEVLLETPVNDLVRVDDRYLSLPYRYIYSGFHDRSKPYDAARAGERASVNNSYFRFDIESGEFRSWYVGDTHSLQELSFIPRSADAAEGDGYLIGTASNYADMRTELMVVDAVEMVELARVYLPFRAKAQVHGRWFSADELPLNDRTLPAYNGRVQG